MQTTIAGHEHVCRNVGSAILRPYAQKHPLRVRGSAFYTGLTTLELVSLPRSSPTSMHSLVHSRRNRWGCCQLQCKQTCSTGRIYGLRQHRSSLVAAISSSAETESTDDRQTARRRRRVSPGVPLVGHEQLEGSWRVFEVSVPLEQDPGKDDYAVSDALCRAVSARLACQVPCKGAAGTTLLCGACQMLNPRVATVRSH